MDGVISVEESPTKTFIDRVLWGNFGFYVVLDKEWVIFWSMLGPCWAFGGPDFDFWHKTFKKKHHNFAVLNAQRSIVICVQTNFPDLGAVRCSMGLMIQLDKKIGMDIWNLKFET